MSSLPVSLSLSLSHPVGETVLSHTRTSGGELCQWFVLALWGRNKDGNMDRSEPTWAAKPPLLWASGSCLLCSILAGCSAVTLCSHKAPDGISKVGEEPSWYSAYRKAEPWISSVPPAWRKVFSVWWMEEQGGNAAVFEWDVRLELPRSGKQLVIISWPKSAEPFTLLGKGQVSLSDKRQGEECWARNQHRDLAVLCGTCEECGRSCMCVHVCQGMVASSGPHLPMRGQRLPAPCLFLTDVSRHCLLSSTVHSYLAIVNIHS